MEEMGVVKVGKDNYHDESIINKFKAFFSNVVLRGHTEDQSVLNDNLAHKELKKMAIFFLDLKRDKKYSKSG